MKRQSGKGRQRVRKSAALRRMTKRSVRAARRTVVTLGELISAAYDVGGSSDGATLLLSALSPLSKRVGRRIELA